MKNFKNILLISGSGRNCGKTTLACNIINKISKNNKVYGLKISPHFHPSEDKQKLIKIEDGYQIYQEFNKSSTKDSSRMLNAGAEEVYFIQSDDKGLENLHNVLKTILPKDAPVVCESGSFSNFYKAGLHLLIKGENADITKKSYSNNMKIADYVLSQNDFTNNEMNFKIDFLSQKWEFKN